METGKRSKIWRHFDALNRNEHNGISDMQKAAQAFIDAAELVVCARADGAYVYRPQKGLDSPTVAVIDLGAQYYQSKDSRTASLAPGMHSQQPVEAVRKTDFM